MSESRKEDNVSIEEFCSALDLSYKVALNQCKKDEELKAFKSDGKWRIPTTIFLKLKKEHEKYKDLISLSYTVKEATEIIDKTRTHTHKLVSTGNIPCGFKYRGKWYVNKIEVQKWKKDNHIDKTFDSYTLSEISDKYNISINILRQYLSCNEDKFFKDNKVWYIHRSRIKDLENDLMIQITLATGEYYSFSDIVEKFQVTKGNAKNIATKYFQKNKLIQNNKSYYKKQIVDNYYNSLNELEKNPKIVSQYYSLNDIGKVMNLTNSGVINLLKREKNLLISTRYKKCYVEKKSFDKFYKTHPISYSYTLGEIVNLFEISRFRVTQMILEGKFKDAEKVNRVWYIPKNKNKKIIEEYIYFNKEKQTSLTLTQLSEESGIPRSSLAKSRYSGAFKNAFINNNIWYVPRKDIDEFYKVNKLLKNTLTTAEVAERIDVQSPSISALVLDNTFPNAFKYKREWRIPLNDVERYEKVLEEKNKPRIFNNTIAVKTMDSIISEHESREEIENTIKLFVRHTNIFLTRSKSSSFNKRMQFSIHMNLLKKLYKVLNQEIYCLSEMELESLFKEGTVFTSTELKVLSKFYKFVCSERGIKKDFTLKQVSPKRNKIGSNNLEIYSPGEFNKIYRHVSEVSLHLNSAIKNDYIANMWGYVILHCTTFMRGNDLLSESLEIDLEVLDIKSLEWFENNQLSNQQIEILIKQLYYYFKNKKTSKTDELVTFLVADSLRKPLAYAVIISELHRRLNQKKYFFYTFYSKNLHTRRISGKSSHQLFFIKHRDFDDFEFKTLKMNRSIGTYLYNSITDGAQNKSDLALLLTQKSRSHKSGDTTALYIQTTNKDGPITDVSYNLSRRGSFGWLYTCLLEFLIEPESLTSKSKTDIISTMRRAINPSDIERYAEFGINHINKNGKLVYQSDNEKLLSHMRKKQINIINFILDYEVEELKKIIYKISNGKLPSKIDHAQCLVSGNCPYPNQNNCLQCEYVIPGKMVLIQLNCELDQTLKRIKNEKNILILRKLSGILIKLLFMLKEARQSYNNQVINTYIPLDKLSENLNQVSEKLYLSEMEW